jgi:RimJ/RimL family protein N-acetyltransferase
MISFKALNEKNKEKTLEYISAGLPSLAIESIRDIVDSFDTGIGDVEFSVCCSRGCLLVRIFDMGRYLFLFPYEVCEGAELAIALSDIAEYAMREEIPLTFSDVPSEYLSLLSGFRHMNIDAEGADGDTYRVQIKTECQLIDEIPEIVGSRVTLNAVLPEDVAAYARLCKDENVNKYWGYDYKNDIPDPDDGYFFQNAMHEFAAGIALCAAIRYKGVFAGEATLYAFDGRGGAEFAIRLLPQYWGRGLGGEAVECVMELAKKIGITVLRSKILKENKPSVAMLRRITGDYWESEDCITFKIVL